MALDCTVGGSKTVVGVAVDQLVGFLGHGVDLGAGGILLVRGLVWNKNRKLKQEYAVQTLRVILHKRRSLENGISF